jgi:pimeloyl-ACP methyl ester carboxylesterase
MTVLMLHDLGRDRNSPGWKHLAESLQTEGHTVLTFDFRGHGESKKVSTPFWNYSVNRYLTSHDAALPAAKQPRTLDAKDLPSTHLPWLIEDIAAARSYLDVRHDEPNGPINTFNLVVLGAGQASALGSLWLGTEGLRYNGVEVSGKTVLKPSEKLSVLQVVWLGMTDPLKLNPKGIYGWLEGAAAKPVVPITFVYGQDDIDTSSLLDEPIRENYGSPFRIPDTRQSGQDLLDSKGKGAERIKRYLMKTLQKLPPQPWIPRRIKTLHSYWAVPVRLLGEGEQVRIYVAKRVGEETLVPVPFIPLGIRIKGLTEPQPLPSRLEP